MLAPLISDSGWIVPRVGRFSKPNSNSRERPGSIVKPYPTDGVTDGLGARGNMRLYFEGCTDGFVAELFMMYSLAALAKTPIGSHRLNY
jgi:hypothetical protein